MDVVQVIEAKWCCPEGIVGNKRWSMFHTSSTSMNKNGNFLRETKTVLIQGQKQKISIKMKADLQVVKTLTFVL